MSQLPEGWTKAIAYPESDYFYTFTHDNYDGAPDSDTSHLFFHADSIEEALEIIKEIEDNKDEIRNA